MPDLSELKDRIKDYPISTVLELYLPLHKKGATVSALCPWHDDSNPSLTINDSKGLFKCWVCNIGGDHIGFVQKFSNIEFTLALQDIAKRLGIPVDEYFQTRSRNPRYALAEKVMLKAAQIYQKYANGPGKKAYDDFLASRGISEKSATEFTLGYAPKNNLLFNYFSSIAQSERSSVINMALELGLLKTNDKGSHYDAFRSRIVFPMMNTIGKVIAFTCRAAHPDIKPKYLNSKDSFLFHKKDLLYGLNFAKSEIKKLDQVILVEGQMDCLMLHQNGFAQTIAFSGTALGDKSPKTLINLSKNIYFALDDDQAGRKAAQRVSKQFFQEGIVPKMINLAPHKDPDEFLQKESALEFKKRINEAKAIIDIILDEILEKVPQNADTESKLQALNRTFEELSPLGQGLYAQEKVIEYAQRIGLQVSKEEILKNYKDSLKNTQKPVLTNTKVIARPTEELEKPELIIVPPTLNKIEKALVQNLVQNPALTQHKEIGEVLDFVEHSGVKQFITDLKNLIYEVADSELKFVLESYLSADGFEQDLKDAIGAGLYSFNFEEVDASIAIKLSKDFLKKMKIENLKVQRDRLKVDRNSSNDAEVKNQIILKITQLEIKMNELKS
jgi:DNA primase